MTIADLEERFAAELRRPRAAAHRKGLLDAATRWSDAVWSTAQALGPLVLSKYEQDQGLDAALRAIFVCGTHRSGTTLVRDLLDGHPCISMLPSEGTFFTNHLPRLRLVPASHQQCFLGCEWLRRLANPINQPPYWLLGRTSAHDSPYVRFARSMMAWWGALETRFSQSSSWPLTAVALAYAHSTGTLSDASPLRWWGEKTPTNERFLQELRAEYPDSKTILVVRHPAAVLASRRAAEQRWGGAFRNRRQVLQDLRTSYEIAAAAEHRRDTQHFLLVRYEHLIDNTQPTLERIAEYLGVEALPTLLRPTVSGLPSYSNSSFAVERAPGCIHPDSARDAAAILTKGDLEQLAAVVGDAAASIGYELAPIASWRTRLRRLGSRLNPPRTPVPHT